MSHVILRNSKLLQLSILKLAHVIDIGSKTRLLEKIFGDFNE